VRDADRVLGVIAWAVAILAALGIVQYLFGNGRYLWVYEFAHNEAGGAVKGTFTNRNHFAGFLAIGCGTVLARALAVSTHPAERWSERDRIGGWLLLAVVAFATVSSLSRGGCLAAVVAGVVGFVCLARTAAWRIPSIVGLVAAGGLAAAALGIHGWDRFIGRFGGVHDDGSASGFGRWGIWRAACHIIAEFPWLGTGAGSHADVAPLAMPPTGEIIFTHAENSYLNIGVEAGIVGLAVALAAVVAGIFGAVALVVRGDQRERTVGAAAAAGLAAGVAHGLADFTWYVPACSTLLMTLGACAVSLAPRRTAWLPVADLRLGPAASLVGGVGVAILLCGSGVRQIAAARAEFCWERSIKLGREIETASSAPAARRDTAAPEQPTGLLEKLDSRIVELERCTALRPDHPRAHSALALARLERFGRSRAAAGKSLGLIDIRLAAGRGGFATHADLVAWVRRATAPHSADLELALTDALEAIRISPLTGEAWCVVAQLAFLAGRPEASAGFVAQALLARPNDSLVLFEGANQAAIDGDGDTAARLWRASFAADRRQRARIIGVLAPMITSGDACELLAPDLDGLRAIEAAWAVRERPEDLKKVRELRRAATFAAAEGKRTNPKAACRLLMEAALLEQRLGRLAEARATLAAAIRIDPSSYDVHRAAADAALAAEDWAAAGRELEWCLLRRPDSRELKEKMEKLRARRDEGGLESAVVPPSLPRR
jgi:O-antigen ligase/tetratricopeptide (TPR) repeat protein